MRKIIKFFLILVFMFFSVVFFKEKSLASEAVFNDIVAQEDQVDVEASDQDEELILDDAVIDDGEIDPSVSNQVDSNPEGDGGIADPEQFQDNKPVTMTKDQEIMLRVISIANKQSELQKEIKEGLNAPETRSKFFIWLFGPDFPELKKLKNIVLLEKENTIELEKISSEAESEAVKKILARVLEESRKEDTYFEQEISKKENSPSLLGWFVKLFY